MPHGYLGLAGSSIQCLSHSGAETDGIAHLKDGKTKQRNDLSLPAELPSGTIWWPKEVNGS